MKNLFYSLIIVLFTSCYGELADAISEDIRLSEKIDSLSNLVTQQNTRINDLLSTLDDLQNQVTNNNYAIDSLTSVSLNSLNRIDSLDNALLLNISRLDSLNENLDLILSQLQLNTSSLDSILNSQNDDSELSNILATIDSLSNDINDIQSELASSSSNSSTSDESSFIYFENGTCKCPTAPSNYSEIIDGVRYYVVDNISIYTYIALGKTNLCTSQVTNMDYLFADGDDFNPLHPQITIQFYGRLDRIGYDIDISFWDTSNVITMYKMFHFFDYGFGTTLNNWDVSKVRDMSSMFESASLNQDISSWNVSNVRNMHSMFKESTFNQDISSWNVSNVIKMIDMFKESTFNQDISSWNVSNVVYCYRFSESNPQWTLPKPNFTNCTP